MAGWRNFSIGAALICALFVIAAHALDNEYFFFAGFFVLQFVVLATAWNLLGGLAGYVNFGSGAFVAAGAYTTVALLKTAALPIAVPILCAMLVAALLGATVGLMTLRLRGIFFSIATVAVAVILETVVMNWEPVGGARGTTLLQPVVPFGLTSYNRFLFVLMGVLAVATVALARHIERSWMGRGLRALRDSEEAAESLGVPTMRLKVMAAALSGALMGMAGALLPLAVSFIEPASAFSLNYAVSALAMPIIGGTASWLGPVIGAVLLGSVQQLVTVTISSELNVLAVGVLLVIFVVAAPQGILGWWRR